MPGLANLLVLRIVIENLDHNLVISKIGRLLLGSHIFPAQYGQVLSVMFRAGCVMGLTFELFESTWLSSINQNIASDDGRHD